MLRLPCSLPHVERHWQPIMSATLHGLAPLLVRAVRSFSAWLPPVLFALPVTRCTAANGAVSLGIIIFARLQPNSLSMFMSQVRVVREVEKENM